MKVLFLTKYPQEGASSRYRVYQYLPFLDQAGIDYEVRPFMSPATYRLSQKSGHTLKKGIYLIAAIIKRLNLFWYCRGFDIIYMQRECLPFGPLVLERSFRRQGKTLLFDYDDALFIFKPNQQSPLASRLKNPQRIPRIMALSHCVIAGNDWLRDRASEYCPKARTFYVAEDLEKFTKKPATESPSEIVIGWLGSPSTEKYLETIKSALINISKAHANVRLKIIGGGRFLDPLIRTEHATWCLESEVAQLHSFDIGIMPLPMEEWSEGKSGGKARSYMSVGLPVVCSAIGFNKELIRDGETGFLAGSPSDWESILSRLIADANLRKTIGAAAREEVEERFDLRVLGPRFARMLQELDKQKH